MCVVTKLRVAATPFWKIAIWHNVHEGMVFKSTNNALFRAATTPAALLLFIKRLAVHACGEDVLKPMSFLSQLNKKKTCTHSSLTHTMTNRDKRAHINIHCLVPERSRLLNDSDNKNSMSCLCYGKRSNMPPVSTWRGCNQFCAWVPRQRSVFDKRSLDPSDSIGSWTLSLCKLQSITVQNSSKIGAAQSYQ